MPTYNTDTRWLGRAIQSVRKQSYVHWELCIADDASTELSVRRVLRRAAKADSRIKLCFRPVNGHISAASNSALALTAGANGQTNPAFQVDASAASQATGLKVTGKAAGSGVAIAAI